MVQEHPAFLKGALRPDEMTKKERFAAVFKRAPRDRTPFVPFILGFAAVNAGMSVGTLYKDPEKSFWSQLYVEQQYGIDGNPACGYADYGAWEFGGQVRFPRSDREQSIMVTRRPVETEVQGWKLKLPEVKSSGYIPFMREFAKLQIQHLGTASCYGMNPFATASSITGVERFCEWMVTKPALCHHLLRLATEHRMQVVQYWVEQFGVENIRVDCSTGPETNDIISPEAFVEFVLPYTKELCERILQMGFRSIYCHICGDHNLNLSLWKQIPFGDPGQLTFGHQMDLDEVICLFGEDNLIFGNIEPALVLAGPPSKIYESCRVAIEKGRKATRGFVLMTGCELSPSTPPYHLWVMRKAVNDFGWYD